MAVVTDDDCCNGKMVCRHDGSVGDNDGGSRDNDGDKEKMEMQEQNSRDDGNKQNGTTIL